MQVTGTSPEHAVLDVDPYAAGCPSRQVLDRIGDRWTVLVVGSLSQGPLRFSELGRRIEGISQKMLTQTLRAMERDGLVRRTVYPVVPPKVEYALTDLGHSLGEAFCGVWHWAEAHLAAVEAARSAFDARA